MDSSALGRGFQERGFCEALRSLNKSKKRTKNSQAQPYDEESKGIKYDPGPNHGQYRDHPGAIYDSIGGRGHRQHKAKTGTEASP